MGRIWIFDLGFITYEISSNRIAREIIFENGAVVSSNPFFSYSYLTNEPKNHFFEEYHHLSGEKYSLIMRIIQLKPDSEITIGPGKASYKFIMKLNNSYIRENKVDQGSSKQVKIQVFGDHAVAWNNYLEDKYGFSKFDTNTLSCYLIGFSLIHSICNIDLEII